MSNPFNEYTKKYSNFLVFLKSLGLGSNQYVKDLEQCNSLIFLAKLREEMDKINSGYTDTILADKVLRKLVKDLNIDVSDYENSDIDKFRRYLLYFYKISKVIL